MIFVVLLIFASQASAVEALGINTINITPSQPRSTDLIMFSISGWAAHTSSGVDHDVFTPNGTALTLDLYVDMGNLGAGSTWYFDKQIQPLAVGTYSLEVRPFWVFSPELNIPQEPYNTSFTVTPEPCTLALLGLGLPFLQAFSKRRN